MPKIKFYTLVTPVVQKGCPKTWKRVVTPEALTPVKCGSYAQAQEQLAQFKKREALYVTLGWQKKPAQIKIAPY